MDDELEDARPRGRKRKLGSDVTGKDFQIRPTCKEDAVEKGN